MAWLLCLCMWLPAADAVAQTVPAPAAPAATAPADTEVLVELVTVLGRIVIAVDEARAPVTAANFLRYVDGRFYDGARFHRVSRVGGAGVAPRGALESIQAGVDPSRETDRFPPIALERTKDTGLRHVAGVVSMARTPRADSARAEFFILLADQPELDHGGSLFADRQGAAVFGRVVEGLDIARRIQWQPAVDQKLMPPVLIIRASRVR
jgi:peptidyl-prolyl cis-trans isomerase A (cyclophilin A)